ncbi:MAG: hypothetical protein AAF628_03365 [Planctomycetota bacterium]
MTLAAALLLLGSCSQLVQYTDELTNPKSRSWLVTTPANAGGFVGFALGVPIDVAALPVTFTVYRIQRQQNKPTADPISTMLFPSFVLWRAMTLVGLPFDMLEFAAYRAWAPRRSLTGEEQAEVEYEIDDETLPTYPVEWIYPRRPADLTPSGSANLPAPVGP